MGDLSVGLKGLLDHSNLFSRNEWASYLGVPESRIEDWLADSALPRPADLVMIELALEGASDVDRAPLDAFSELKDLRFGQATPIVPVSFGTNVGQTIGEYMRTPIFPGRGLEHLPTLGINVVPEAETDSPGTDFRDECIRLANGIADIVTIRIDPRSFRLIACGTESAIEELERAAKETGRVTTRGVPTFHAQD